MTGFHDSLKRFYLISSNHISFYMRENQQMHQLFIQFINYVW
jgi:hypothetical protein